MRRNLLLAFAVASLIASACGRSPIVSGGPPASESTSTASAATNVPHILFPDGYGVKVEIAADEPTREQGLMFRDRLPDATGMIFIFPQSGEYPFWMKNTLIPLDMVWIDEGHKIVHVAHDVPPCQADPCPSYAPNATAKYVLELAAGVAKQHGLKDGDTLRMIGLDQVIVR